MKETSYIIVVTKSIVRNRHWEEFDIRCIPLFAREARVRRRKNQGRINP